MAINLRGVNLTVPRQPPRPVQVQRQVGTGYEGNFVPIRIPVKVTRTDGVSWRSCIWQPLPRLAARRRGNLLDRENKHAEGGLRHNSVEESVPIPLAGVGTSSVSTISESLPEKIAYAKLSPEWKRYFKNLQP